MSEITVSEIGKSRVFDVFIDDKEYRVTRHEDESFSENAIIWSAVGLNNDDWMKDIPEGTLYNKIIGAVKFHYNLK